jgi:hypothetical protein
MDGARPALGVERGLHGPRGGGGIERGLAMLGGEIGPGRMRQWGDARHWFEAGTASQRLTVAVGSRCFAVVLDRTRRAFTTAPAGTLQR